MLSAAVATEPRGSARQPQTQSAEQRSVPALLCKHATELIQWLAPEAPAPVVARIDHRRSEPLRQPRSIAGFPTDVFGKVGIYRLAGSARRGDHGLCCGSANHRLAAGVRPTAPHIANRNDRP